MGRHYFNKNVVFLRGPSNNFSDLSLSQSLLISRQTFGPPFLICLSVQILEMPSLGLTREGDSYHEIAIIRIPIISIVSSIINSKDFHYIYKHLQPSNFRLAFGMPTLTPTINFKGNIFFRTSYTYLPQQFVCCLKVSSLSK